MIKADIFDLLTLEARAEIDQQLKVFKNQYIIKINVDKIRLI